MACQRWLLWASLVFAAVSENLKSDSTCLNSQDGWCDDGQELDYAKVADAALKLQQRQEAWGSAGAAGASAFLLTKIGELWHSKAQVLLLKDRHSILASSQEFHAAVQKLQNLKPGQLEAAVAEAESNFKNIWSKMQYLDSDEQLYKDLLAQWNHYDKEWTSAKNQLEKIQSGLGKGRYISSVKFREHTEIANEKIAKGSLKRDIASKQNHMKVTAALSAGQGIMQLWSAMSEASLAVSEMTRQQLDKPMVLRQLEAWKADLQKFKARLAQLLLQEEVNAETLRRAAKGGQVLMGRLETWISEHERTKANAERQESLAWASMGSNVLGAGGAGYQMATSLQVAGGITPVLQGVALGAYSLAAVANGVTTVVARDTSHKAEQHIVAMKSARSELDQATSQLQEVTRDEDPFDF